LVVGDDVAVVVAEVVVRGATVVVVVGANVVVGKAEVVDPGMVLRIVNNAE
jgi:hypothetical protein